MSQWVSASFKPRIQSVMKIRGACDRERKSSGSSSSAAETVRLLNGFAGESCPRIRVACSLASVNELVLRSVLMSVRVCECSEAHRRHRREGSARHTIKRTQNQRRIQEKRMEEREREEERNGCIITMMVGHGIHFGGRESVRETERREAQSQASALFPSIFRESW